MINLPNEWTTQCISKNRDTVLQKHKTNTSCLTVKKHEAIKFKPIVICKWNSGKTIAVFFLVICKHFGSPCSCDMLISQTYQFLIGVKLNSRGVENIREQEH